MADALDYAHKRKVIHRDIKPHNILLDCARQRLDHRLWPREAQGRGKPVNLASLRRNPARHGAERLQGKSDGRDDIYALAATLYEFLALRPVFDASDPHQLLSKIEHEPPPPLRRIDRQVHPDLAAIIERSLAKDPADRYGSAAELRDELRRFLEGRPVKTRPVPTYARVWKWCQRNPWLAAANISALALTIALAIGSTIAAMVYHDKNEQLSGQARQLRLSEIDLRIKDRDSRMRLFESQAERARAGRFSRRVGQRFDSLAALAEAAKIGRELKLPAARFDRLRDEAIACMALPDVKPAGRPIILPEDHVAFAFDEGMTRYAIRRRDGTVLVHRMSDNQEIARFQSEGDRDIWVFRFSPDGRYLASIDKPTGAVKVWDINQSVLCLRDPGAVSNTAARFSPDSRRVAMAHDEGSLVVYDLTVGRPVKNWRGPAPAQDLAYRPDGKQVAVTYHSSPRSCHILDAETGVRLRAIPLDTPTAVAWSPDGKRLVVSGKDDQILIYDAATGEHTVALKGASGGATDGVFDATGTMVICNGWEGRLRLWDAVLGQQGLSLTGYGPLMCSRDNRIPVVLGNQANFWQIDSAVEYRTLAHASSTPMKYRAPSIRRDGRILAAASDRGVVLWDLAAGAELVLLPIGPSWGCIFEGSGDLLTNGAAGVWRWPVQVDPTKGKLQVGPPRRLPLPGTDCMLVEDQAGRTIVTSAHDLAYIAVGERNLKVGPLDDCRGVSVSPDGQWLATGSHANGGATVWKLPEGTPVVKLVEGPVGVSFTPDGKWLATSYETTRLWEVGTWREAINVDAEYRDASADGKLAVFRNSGRTALLVDLQSGLTLARFESPDQHQVGAAVLSPDGSRLVVSTNDSPTWVHVWDLRAIRRRLTEMGLDWHAPAYPEDDPARADLPPLPPLQVDYGPLAEHLELYSEGPDVLLERFSAQDQARFKRHRRPSPARPRALVHGPI